MLERTFDGVEHRDGHHHLLPHGRHATEKRGGDSGELGRDARRCGRWRRLTRAAAGKAERRGDEQHERQRHGSHGNPSFPLAGSTKKGAGWPVEWHADGQRDRQDRKPPDTTPSPRSLRRRSRLSRRFERPLRLGDDRDEQFPYLN